MVASLALMSLKKNNHRSLTAKPNKSKKRNRRLQRVRTFFTLQRMILLIQYGKANKIIWEVTLDKDLACKAKDKDRVKVRDQGLVV